jgi:hypothetical protein
MELDTTVQVSLKDLLNQDFDLIIASCGYESRCTFLSQRINSGKVKKKIALAFIEQNDCLNRPINDKIFTQLGFEFITVSKNSNLEINQILKEQCENINGKEMNILVDYSSMPKLWYESIINFFSEEEFSFRNLKVWFSYTPSEYSQSKQSINKYFDSDFPVKLSDKPKALIIGLGYEKGRAEELSLKLNAQVTYSFYSDPAIDPRFVLELLDNNRDLLKKLDPGKLITYPIFDLNYINTSLTQLCVDLRLTYQIVLAPIGPKPFTLMCFLLNARYPDIKIWRFSSESSKSIYDNKPHGELLIYKVHFTCENADYDD